MKRMDGKHVVVVHRPFGREDVKRSREVAILNFKRLIEQERPFDTNIRYSSVETMCAPCGSNMGIFLAQYNLTKTYLVVKKICNVILNEEAERECIMESHILSNVLNTWHPRIVRLYTTFRGPDQSFFLELEYHPKGSLHSYSMDFPDLFTFKKVRSVLQDIASAIFYCHSNSVAHCDIKNGNILVKEDGSVCLADFGCARILDDNVSTYRGEVNPRGYRPPEVLLGLEWSFSVDVWALACSMIDLTCIHRGIPSIFLYDDTNWAVHLAWVCSVVGGVPDGMLNNISEADKTYIRKTTRISDLAGIEELDQPLYRLLMRMLSPHSAHRIAAGAIFLHSFD